MAYEPSIPPAITNIEELRKYVEEEFGKIARAENDERAEINFRTLFTPPSRIREGMIVSADGTSWNPGSGAGLYQRISGAWVKL